MGRIENDCVGCDHCISCGRNRNYAVYSCDKCGRDIDENDKSLYELDGKEVCLKCYALAKAKDLVRDLIDDDDFMEIVAEWASADAIDRGKE